MTVLTVGFGALSAYTVARLKLRWALSLMQANVVARFLPAIVLMIPLYVVVRSLGQLNTLHAVILTETGFLLPYAIVILVPFFANIPADLEDAARSEREIPSISTGTRIVSRSIVTRTSINVKPLMRTSGFRLICLITVPQSQNLLRVPHTRSSPIRHRWP